VLSFAKAFAIDCGGEFASNGDGTLTYTPPLTRQVNGETITLSHGEREILKMYYRALEEYRIDCGIIVTSGEGFISHDGRTIHVDAIQETSTNRVVMKTIIEKYTADFQALHGGELQWTFDACDSVEILENYVLPENNERASILRADYFNGIYELIRDNNLAAVN
jgi:hypothetical protein